MVSKNQLLGSGVNYEALARQIPVANKEQKFAPAWRYHKDCKAGRVIKTDKALAELDAAGWVDHPGKVTSLPGHEAIFEETYDENNVDEEELKTALNELLTDSLIDENDSDNMSKIDQSDKEE